MKKSNRKIDEHGDYCPFPGITVIAGILDQDFPLWQRVHNVIESSELIRPYFTALPYESYHMTTTDLFTEQFDGADHWETFVHDKLPFFQALHAKLEEKKITPMINIQHIHFSSVIQLVVTLPEEQRHHIHEIAAEFGLKDKVPRALHIPRKAEVTNNTNFSFLSLSFNVISEKIRPDFIFDIKSANS